MMIESLLLSPERLLGSLPTLQSFAHSLIQGVSQEVSGEKLAITDSRTKRTYEISIVNNAVRAVDFRAISTLGLTASRLDCCGAGLRVADPGLQNTAVTESKVSYVDGTHGTIQYRNFSIGHLFENSDFEEVAFLLIWDHLPFSEEKVKFRRDLARQSNPSQMVLHAIKAFPSTTPAFLMVIAGLSAWAASDPANIPVHAGRNLYQGEPEAVDEGVVRTLAAVATVVALVYCHQQDRDFTPADPEGSFVSNQLLMMGIVDETSGKPNPSVVKVLDRLWILYADHEMTNSTTAFLQVTSTLADPISGCIASATAGSGPLHAGAIDLAYKSFAEIGCKEKVPKLIADVKAKKFRLMGYGHRIYKTVDPRTKYLQTLMGELSDEIDDNSLLSVAMEIDRIASKDSYFTSRNLKANADLYGCFVFSALGFAPEIVTAMAMISRTSGAMAHWREAMAKPPCLWRPQQLFTGNLAGC